MRAQIAYDEEKNAERENAKIYKEISLLAAQCQYRTQVARIEPVRPALLSPDLARDQRIAGELNMAHRDDSFRFFPISMLVRSLVFTIPFMSVVMGYAHFFGSKKGEEKRDLQIIDFVYATSAVSMVMIIGFTLACKLDKSIYSMTAKLQEKMLREEKSGVEARLSNPRGSRGAILIATRVNGHESLTYNHEGCVVKFLKPTCDIDVTTAFYRIEDVMHALKFKYYGYNPQSPMSEEVYANLTNYASNIIYKKEADSSLIRLEPDNKIHDKIENLLWQQQKVSFLLPLFLQKHQDSSIYRASKHVLFEEKLIEDIFQRAGFLSATRPKRKKISKDIIMDIVDGSGVDSTESNEGLRHRR